MATTQLGVPDTTSIAFGNADISRAVTVFDSVSLTIAGPFASLATLRADESLHNHLVYGYTGGLGFDINLVLRHIYFAEGRAVGEYLYTTIRGRIFRGIIKEI